jgi:hypothetical protein
VIPQHGDLFLGNLIGGAGSWRVVDWETFGAVDLPFYDLFTLLLSLLRSTGDTPEHWDPALARKVPQVIAFYAQQLNLSVADIPLLLPLSLANWFYIHWIDGRQKFTATMCKMLQHYFDNTPMWETVFAPASTRTT